MKHEIKLEIQAQPDDTSCGPTCLHALYRYYRKDDVSLKQLINDIHKLDSGGTLIEILACDALRRGFDATIYTYHLQMFDPTWFAADGVVHDPESVSQRLQDQLKVKKWNRLTPATKACREFLSRGGQLKMADLTGELIAGYISQGYPIIAGLSSTFLYREMRETGAEMEEDDVRGEPQGHFVALVGYDSRKREVIVADPLDVHPPFYTAKYRLAMDRLINAILLGILTNDANLLVITPKGARAAAEDDMATTVPVPRRKRLPTNRNKTRPGR